jgi:hypothetical protein
MALVKRIVWDKSRSLKEIRIDVYVSGKSFTAIMKTEPQECGFESACDAMMFNKYSDMKSEL